MMRLFQLSKPLRWRTVIGLFIAVVVVNFSSVSTANAWCLFFCANADISGTVKFPSPAEFRKMGEELAKGVREEVEKTDLKGMGQQFAEGVRKEFDAAMDSLFSQKIEPLVKDINKLLKARIAQTDKMVENRLKQIDELIQNTFARFQAVANQTIDKIKTDIIDHTKAATDDTIDKIKTDLIDHTKTATDDTIDKIKTDIIEHTKAATDDTIDKIKTDLIDHTKAATDDTIDKIKTDLIDHTKAATDDSIAQIKTDLINNAFAQFNQAVEKTKSDLIDNTFTQLDELRKNFHTDVNLFFDRTEYIINTVDCKVEGTLEKLRQDMQSTGKEIAKELKASLPKLSFSFTKTVSKPHQSVSSKLVACYQQLGLKEPPEPFQYSTIYDIKKCKVLRTLTLETPLRQILNVYVDLKAQAARMACLQRGAGHHATLHYTWDWLEFGYWYDFWDAYK
jgi:DNA anti-recombination protein RmuC